MNDSEIKYLKYKNYTNVRSRKIKKLIACDASQVKTGGQTKDRKTVN